MNTQTKVILGLSVALALVVGILIGCSFGRMHRMPGGAMMHNEAGMSGMMHGMNMGLEGKTGDEFDKAFLSEMIVHHEGAVAMAQKVLAVSKRPELIKLANEIIAAQTKEIGMMKDWKAAWFK